MYILFDIGGTHTRIVDIDTLDHEIHDPIVVETPPYFDDAMKLFHEHATRLAQGKSIQAIAGGITGVLDPHHQTRLVSSPHHDDWIGKELFAETTREHACPAYIMNDTAMVGLGEVSRGAGKGYDIVAYITISTGVGGARFIKGKLDVARYGFEIGHHIINATSLLSYEDLVSGTAIANQYQIPPKDILGKDIWDEESRNVAVGLLNVMYFWSPDIIVLGGGMMKRPDQMTIEMIKPHLEHMNHLFPAIPELKKAELGSIGGLYGSLEYLRQEINTP